MPKGVYDRTKTKEQRAAEKAAKLAVKKRPGKRRGRQAVMVPEPPVTEQLVGQVHEKIGSKLLSLPVCAALRQVYAGSSEGNADILKLLDEMVEIQLREILEAYRSAHPVTVPADAQVEEAVGAPSAPDPEPVPVPMPAPVPFSQMANTAV
jgi:hypothetical protein